MPNSDIDLDAIQRRSREALSFATEQVGGGEYAPETVMEHFDQDVPSLIDALGRAFAVIRQDAITRTNQERKIAELNQRIEQAHESIYIEEFDGDSCPDLETTIAYAVSRYHAVAQSEADAADRIQELRIQLDAIGGMQTIQHDGNRLRVITVALHDRLCTARVASRQDTTPPVLHCHFCGFCYPPLSDTRPNAEMNRSGGADLAEIRCVPGIVGGHIGCDHDPDRTMTAPNPGLADHAFRSLNGATSCVAVVGPLGSGEHCGRPADQHPRWGDS